MCGTETLLLFSNYMCMYVCIRERARDNCIKVLQLADLRIFGDLWNYEYEYRLDIICYREEMFCLSIVPFLYYLPH